MRASENILGGLIMKQPRNLQNVLGNHDLWEREGKGNPMGKGFVLKIKKILKILLFVGGSAKWL